MKYKKTTVQSTECDELRGYMTRLDIDDMLTVTDLTSEQSMLISLIAHREAKKLAPRGFSARVSNDGQTCYIIRFA